MAPTHPIEFHAPFGRLALLRVRRRSPPVPRAVRSVYPTATTSVTAGTAGGAYCSPRGNPPCQRPKPMSPAPLPRPPRTPQHLRLSSPSPFCRHPRVTASSRAFPATPRTHRHCKCRPPRVIATAPCRPHRPAPRPGSSAGARAGATLLEPRAPISCTRAPWMFGHRGPEARDCGTRRVGERPPSGGCK